VHCGVRPRIADGCWLVLRIQLIGVIDDADRPWSTRLPRDEPTTLQSLNHLIHGRCRDEEVSLDIRFGWGNTEPEDVPCDERKVLALTAGGLRTVVETFPHRVAGAASQGGDEAVLKQLNGEDGVIGEVNVESASVRLCNVRHRLPGDVFGDVLYVDGQPSHGDHSLHLTRDLRPNVRLQPRRLMIASGAVGCKPVLGSLIEDGGSNSRSTVLPSSTAR